MMNFKKEFKNADEVTKFVPGNATFFPSENLTKIAVNGNIYKANHITKLISDVQKGEVKK